MKKNLTKLLALMMALALVFSLAACGDKTEEQSTNPSDNQVAESVNGDETVAPADSTDPSAANAEPSSTNEESQTPGETEKPGANEGTTKASSNAGTTAAPSVTSKLPSGKTEIVNAFNNGIVAVKGAQTRTLKSGTIKAFGINVNLSNEQGVKDAFNRKNASLSNAKLSKISQSDVKGTPTVSGSADNYTITIQLNDVKKVSTALQHGSNGYMYFVDLAEARTLTNDILAAFKLGTATIQEGESYISLKGGKIVATVKNGKITKATLTFNELVEAKAKWNGLTVTANIEGTASVVYTAK